MPLLRDIFDILGKVKCEVMSCVDIKDAFHSIRLNERSKEFCGILPYFGSPHYRYERLPMGLAISPAAWSMYITTLLDTFGPRKKSLIAIMDDLLIHSTFEEHFELVEILLKGLISHGLKLSPKKSQLFRTKLVYIGNIFKIVDNHMTVKPLCTRVEAIQNFPAPKCPKDCKSFCGVVNYLALFCPDLQKLLQPIYHLTKKEVPFVWTKLQQKNFKEIKKRLCERPVLNLPTESGRFIYTVTLADPMQVVHCGKYKMGSPTLSDMVVKHFPLPPKITVLLNWKCLVSSLIFIHGRITSTK